MALSPLFDLSDLSFCPRYANGGALVDKSCQQMARYMGRLVGWYTAGGFEDECGH